MALRLAVAALEHKPQLKTFYATMHVTRVEEWFVEAESAEEARELLLSGRWAPERRHRRVHPCRGGANRRIK
jgi:hypothetical protein